MSKLKRRRQMNKRREFATHCPSCDGWGIHYQLADGTCINPVIAGTKVTDWTLDVESGTYSAVSS